MSMIFLTSLVVMGVSLVRMKQLRARKLARVTVRIKR